MPKTLFCVLRLLTNVQEPITLFYVLIDILGKVAAAVGTDVNNSVNIANGRVADDGTSRSVGTHFGLLNVFQGRSRGRESLL
jgi:hypothetical protein